MLILVIDEEMDVIVHKHPCNDFYVLFGRVSPEKIDEEAPIGIILKDYLPSNRTQYYMINASWAQLPRYSWHWSVPSGLRLWWELFLYPKFDG